MTAPQSLPDSSIHLHSEIDLAHLRSIVEEAGGEWRGIQEAQRAVILFNEPVTRNTLALLPEDVTVEAVRAKLQACMKRFARSGS